MNSLDKPIALANEGTMSDTDNIISEPFNLEEHLSVIRSNRQKRNNPNQKRYVLFVLDSSGSITSMAFSDVKNVVADLSLLFCDAKIAVLSYSSIVRNEFCFPCYNNWFERHSAIKSIPFLNKGTATGDALRYGCNYMLNTPCGFPSSRKFNPPLVDVIVLTDGKYNRGENPCNAAKCFVNIPDIRVKILSIGVRNYDHKELECIEAPSGGSHSGLLITVENITQLRNLTKKIIMGTDSTALC